MRCAFRGILTAAGLAISLALVGCGSFDPSDWLDFNKEKPIPGERQLVFPEGVPGVPQGVPPELVKGNQPPPTDPAMVATATPDQPERQPQTSEPAAASTSVAARTESEPKAKPRPAGNPAAKPPAKPKPKVAARPKPKQAGKPTPKKPPQQTTAAPAKPGPESAQAARRSGGQNPIWGAHPTRGTNAPWPPPEPQHRAPAPWPEAPSPNTFSR